MWHLIVPLYFEQVLGLQNFLTVLPMSHLDHALCRRWTRPLLYQFCTVDSLTNASSVHVQGLNAHCMCTLQRVHWKALSGRRPVTMGHI